MSINERLNDIEESTDYLANTEYKAKVISTNDYNWLMKKVEESNEFQQKIQFVLDSPLTDFDKLHDVIQAIVNKYRIK